MSNVQPIRLLSNGKQIDPTWNDFIQQSNILTLPIVGQGTDPVTTCSSPRFFGCTFSTSKVLESFEIAPQKRADEPSLVFGLDTAADKDLFISNIFQAFGVPTTGLKQPIGSIVDVLSQQIKDSAPAFKIDNTLGSKNGTWIIATRPDSLLIATALTFKLNGGQPIDFGTNVQKALKDTLGLDVDLSSLKFSAGNLPRLRLKNRTFVVKKEVASGSTSSVSFSTSSLFELIVELPILGFLINLKIGNGGQLAVSLLNNGGGFSSIAQLLSDAPLESEETPTESGLLENFQLWNLSAQFPTFPDPPDTKVTFSIGFIVTLKILGQDLTVGLNYDGQLQTFSGGLLFKGMFDHRLDPSFDDLSDLPRGMLKNLPDGYDLASSSTFESLPKAVPTKLTQALITYKKGSGGNPSSLSFSGTMTSAAATRLSGDSVPFPFDWTEVGLNFQRQSSVGSRGPQTSLNISSSFMLNSPSDRFQSGVMSMGFSFLQEATGGSTWSLTGRANNIQLGAIAQWFDPGLSGEVLEILGKLAIDEIDVSYTCDRNVASSFLFTGIVSFGELRLKLYYQYATAQAAQSGNTAAHQRKKSSGTSDPNLSPLDSTKDMPSFWQLDAYLDTAGPGSTIGSIADSIVDNASENIPSFVSDIEIHPDAPSAKMMTLHVGKSSKKTTTGTIQRATFLLNVSLSTVEFTFAQVSTKMNGQTNPKTKTTPTAKRLLRLSVGQLPFIENLPIVKELPQPYQELQYMWSPESGLTRDEVAALNEKLILDGSDNKLYFKPVTRAAADPTAITDPIVLVEGHHFVVVQGNQAIVDHLFMPEPKPSKHSDDDNPESNPGSTDVTTSLDRKPPAPSDDSTKPKGNEVATKELPPSKGAIKKHTQFLSISAISFQYKQKHLWIFLDASITLGPLEFSLIGFGVGLNVSGLKLNDLSTLTTIKDGIDFQLRGMEVAFDKPPILIAGCFYHDVVQNGDQREEFYRGGIAVTVPPYTFVAVGEYAEVSTLHGTFKSVFVYAKLDGPIIDFEFAILKGLRIGFGYNSVVRTPAVEELFQFPLISDSVAEGAGNHPGEILEKMRGGPNPWVQLKQDSYWFAFGFTISSFDIINATAVALVSFHDGGPIFSIFGNLTIAMPPESKSESARLFYVEVLLMAELNFVEDCFKFMAALAPTSYVYVPMARLHGGLALYSFFGRNPHAGDWVLSVGGYHRSFAIPSHYPLPSRIGLDFNVGIISIRGDGYFAITPKAVMAGAMIRCELSIGPVFAWLDAAFDAMVQFEPMHYWVSMHVEVGVECDIPLLFFTIHIRIHIGAFLEIQGPDFGGTADVDFWFFSFSFSFGATTHGPDPLKLQQFYELCEKGGPADVSPNSVATENLTVKLKFSLEDGSFAMPPEDSPKDPKNEPDDKTKPDDKKKPDDQKKPDDTGAGTKWFVKGGSFKFRVSSVFAVTEAFIETEDSSKRTSTGKTVLLGHQDISTMQEVLPKPALPKLSSMPMQLSATSADADGIDSKLYIGIQETDDGNLAISGFKPSFVMKPMPQALWADPAKPPDKLSSDKGTIDLPMAVTFEAPDPILAEAKVPAFNATDMAKACAGANTIPQLPAPTQTDFLPSELTISATDPAAWKNMKETWTTAGQTNLALANDITTLCMQTLGWDAPPTDMLMKAKAAKMEPWKVPVNFPTRLVRGTGREEQGIQDGFENFYLEVPMSTAAFVAIDVAG